MRVHRHQRDRHVPLACRGALRVHRLHQQALPHGARESGENNRNQTEVYDVQCNQIQMD